MADAEREWRVVRGTPSAEELAALVGAVVAGTRPISDSGDPRPSGSRWERSARPADGALPRPGPDAWRASALPR
ncbi:acyl-CoA carboxylase subunit epsilon [Micromonospora sp. LOL_023]|uniref:acyl-CoA carboxylase subunit epsilon n=1 Tax=Micromonospora sp. LOL_023 TaxID=3345418 RepID=UPI003A85668C